MPKGHIDIERQLDALAHVIAENDIKAVAKKWGITRNGVYQLARSAVKRLQGPMRRQRPNRKVGRPKRQRAVLSA